MTRSLLLVLRAGPCLRGPATVRQACALVLVNILLAGIALSVLHRTEPGAPRPAADFVSFYAAGVLAGEGRPADAYDPVAHGRVEATQTGPDHPYQFFFYPPPFLLLCVLLPALPYHWSLAVFDGLTLLLFLCSFRALCGGPWRTWLLPTLAFTPSFWTAGLGQNAFLSAALLATATRLTDRRPALSGSLFGALCFKPHLGLLMPVALAAGGRWRAFAAASCTVLALAGASWLAFGTETWAAFFRSFAGSGDTYASGRIAFAGMVSPFGAARLVGLPVGAAFAVQGAATVLAAAIVTVAWRSNASLPVRSASLLAGTALAVPVLLVYDQMICLVATAWLVREGGQVPPPWERTALCTAFLLPLASVPLGMLGVPCGPVPATLLLLLCARRLRAAVLERRSLPTPVPAG